MTGNQDILIVGGYGEVGRRIAALLESAHPGRVVVAGRNPERAADLRARRIDIYDPESITSALVGVGTLVACVREREPHLLQAAIRRGLAYTSVAPPSIKDPALTPFHAEAQRTGARIVLATGLEPGISAVLARMGADRVGPVDAIETALLLGIGDAYGPDSMGFILDELAHEYSILIEGQTQAARAFSDPVRVVFPAPFGERRAYRMPFSDEFYYPRTLGARTAVARIALDPPWIGSLVAGLAKLGAGAWKADSGRRSAIHYLTERLRKRYADRNQFSLVVEVRGAGGVLRASLSGTGQAHATAVAASATVEALSTGEVAQPGVWLAEQILEPGPFLRRIATEGLVPVMDQPVP